MSEDGVLRREDIEAMVESWKTEPIHPDKELISPTEYKLRKMGMSFLGPYNNQLANIWENARRVEQSISEVYVLYGYGSASNYSYSQIVDACNVLCSHHPEPALGTLAMLKGGYPHYVKEFMNILDTLANPAKAESVKDKPE